MTGQIKRLCNTRISRIRHSTKLIFDTNTKKASIFLMIILASITLAGCTGALPEARRNGLVEAQWGNSFEYWKNNQIVDKKPAKIKQSDVAISGKTSEIGMTKYYNDLTNVENVETSIGSK